MQNVGGKRQRLLASASLEGAMDDGRWTRPGQDQDQMFFFKTDLTMQDIRCGKG